MTKLTAPHSKKTYAPKQMVGTIQTSFMVGIMRAKGYVSQDYILRIITALSTASNFSDITFEEARYLVMRLPNVTREKIDAFMDGNKSLVEIGLPPYQPNYKAFGKRNNKGAGA